MQLFLVNLFPFQEGNPGLRDMWSRATTHVHSFPLILCYNGNVYNVLLLLFHITYLGGYSISVQRSVILCLAAYTLLPSYTLIY